MIFDLNTQENSPSIFFSILDYTFNIKKSDIIKSNYDLHNFEICFRLDEQSSIAFLHNFQTKKNLEVLIQFDQGKWIFSKRDISMSYKYKDNSLFIKAGKTR